MRAVRARDPSTPSPSLRDGEVIVEAARGWIGTRYEHQASLKGEGADCLGLVRGVWRELIGAEPEALPPYSWDWAEVGGEETLLEAARRWLVEIPVGEAKPGDVLLFRMAPGYAAKHCAILSSQDGQGRMIHAYWGRAVIETWLGNWWWTRLAAVFRFPSPGSASARGTSLAGMTGR